METESRLMVARGRGRVEWGVAADRGTVFLGGDEHVLKLWCWLYASDTKPTESRA